MNAHVIPRSFFELVKSGGQYSVGLILKNDIVETDYIQAGPSDEEILCELCERKFSEWDNYGFKILGKDWNLEQTIKLSMPRGPDADAFRVAEFDYDTLSLFILSVLWRASVSTHPFYNRISLGPKEDPIRQLLLDGRAPDPQECLIMIGATVDHKYRNTMLAPARYRIGHLHASLIYFPNIFVLVRFGQGDVGPLKFMALNRANNYHILKIPFTHSPLSRLHQAANETRRRRWVGKPSGRRRPRTAKG